MFKGKALNSLTPPPLIFSYRGLATLLVQSVGNRAEKQRVVGSWVVHFFWRYRGLSRTAPPRSTFKPRLKKNDAGSLDAASGL